MKPFREADGYAEDLQLAYDYYKGYSPKAAKRFLASYLKAVNAIQSFPRMARRRRNRWHQLVIPGHPNYSIFYKELSFCWLFAGLLPTMNDPDAIQVRLLIREAGELED